MNLSRGRKLADLENRRAQERIQECRLPGIELADDDQQEQLVQLAAHGLERFDVGRDRVEVGDALARSVEQSALPVNEVTLLQCQERIDGGAPPFTV